MRCECAQCQEHDERIATAVAAQHRLFAVRVMRRYSEIDARTHQSVPGTMTFTVLEKGRE